MKTTSYTLEFITPCFCAGADQTVAELRAPAIRGQLRWWFRALGGTSEQEKIVFGGVHGETKSSAIITRIKNIKIGPEWKTSIGSDPNKPISYIWFYATVSADKKRWWQNGQKGSLNTKGHIPPGSTFTLELIQKKALPDKEQLIFNQSLDCFIALGAIGMRATRAMGAFYCKDSKSIEELPLKAQGFLHQTSTSEFTDAFEAVRHAEGYLIDLRKNYFPAGKKGDKLSSLGTSTPRQTSAVFFRPIKLPSGKFKLIIFEAPQGKVLGKETSIIAQRVGQALKKLDLSKVAQNIRQGSISAPSFTPRDPRGRPIGGSRI